MAVVDWMSILLSLVAGAVQTFGRVDGVVNLVGSILLKPAHTLSPAEFDETLRLNLSTAFYAVRAASRHILKNSEPTGGAVTVRTSSGKTLTVRWSAICAVLRE